MVHGPERNIDGEAALVNGDVVELGQYPLVGCNPPKTVT